MEDINLSEHVQYFMSIPKPNDYILITTLSCGQIIIHDVRPFIRPPHLLRPDLDVFGRTHIYQNIMLVDMRHFGITRGKTDS